jgi:uncharacterized protein (DUF1810 family)
VRAQESTFERALSEIKSGEKQSHWMWYIFPQFDGLGWSLTSRRYAVKSMAEADAYLSHPVLGPRLVESAEALLQLHDLSANDVLGHPDDLKLRSCATLFAQVSPKNSVFHRILDRYYEGKPDEVTLRLIQR